MAINLFAQNVIDAIYPFDDRVEGHPPPAPVKNSSNQSGGCPVCGGYCGFC